MKNMMDIMDLAPPPHRVEEGRVVDANGQPVAWISARLNLGDDSWRVIANKLAAAAEMEAALSRAADLCIGLRLEHPHNQDIAEIGDQCRAALRKAHGESP